MKKELALIKSNETNAEKWLALIKQYDIMSKGASCSHETHFCEKTHGADRRHNDISELTAPLLNALIEKIVIHQAVKNDDGTTEQEVEIYYRFIGKID